MGNAYSIQQSIGQTVGSMLAEAAQNLTIPLCSPVLAPPSTVRPDAVHPSPGYGN